MQDAEKQFAKTRSEADKLKLETAQADYDNMVRNLKSVTKAAGDTEKAISKIEDTAGRTIKFRRPLARSTFSSTIRGMPTPHCP